MTESAPSEHGLIVHHAVVHHGKTVLADVDDVRIEPDGPSPSWARAARASPCSPTH